MRTQVMLIEPVEQLREKWQAFLENCQQAFSDTPATRERVRLTLLQMSPVILLVVCSLVGFMLIHVSAKLIVLFLLGFALLMAFVFLFMTYMEFSYSWDGVALFEKQTLRSLTNRERRFMERAGVAHKETYQQTFQRLEADMAALKQQMEQYRLDSV